MMPFQKFPEFDEMHFKEVFLGQLCGMYGMYHVWLNISVMQSEESKKELQMCQGACLCVSLSCCLLMTGGSLPPVDAAQRCP